VFCLKLFSVPKKVQMESTIFSKNLIEKTIQCFKEEDGFDLSPEQANEYLNSLAGLFLAFADKQLVQPLWGERAVPHDLISPHNCNDK
jgi:hypothetical protein